MNVYLVTDGSRSATTYNKREAIALAETEHLALCERMIERFSELLSLQLDGAGRPFHVNHVEWLTANLDRWIAERNHTIGGVL